MRKIFEDFLEDDPILDEFYLSTYFVVLVFSLMLTPFTLVKKMEKLKFMAFLGVAGISIFVLSLIVNFFVILNQNSW